MKQRGTWCRTGNDSGGTGGDRWETWVDQGQQDNDTEFGQERQLQYDALDLFDYRDTPPPLPVLAAHLKLLHLCSKMLSMMSLMVALRPVGAMYRGQGATWGGPSDPNLLLFVMLLLVVVVVVDMLVVIILSKLPIIKKGGRDRAPDVRMLFEGDPARPSHPLRMQRSDKQGECVLKIRCRIYCTLISYHDSLCTCTATHIRHPNITTVQDILQLLTPLLLSLRPMTSPSLSTSCQLHLQWRSNLPAMLMRRTFAALSYGPNMQPYNRIKWTIAKWIVADCLPYRVVEMCAFRAMMRSLGLKCPGFGRKTITTVPKYCSIFQHFLTCFFPSLK